ncbi:MAG: SMC family ATPase [Anaerolineae bacterium]|nr:SMC family ATPase [Anaerolineae bacterium]
MIPIRLELRNFLAYREPAPLDFTGIHLACLAGPNGAGKSSLLDAITWALWGRARARRDDELIHIGQSEMRVVFDFELDNNRYQVIRQRELAGRGRSTLDFMVCDGDEWHTLNEPTMRQTQAKIESVLRMEYETFINSAFLLQGRADEFTVKTPAERKKVLSDILGLDIWARYEDRAKERIRALDATFLGMEAQIQAIDGELAEEDARKAAFTEAQARLIEATARREALDKEVQALTVAEIDLRHKQSQRAERQRRTETGQRELEAAQREAAALEPQLQAARALLAEKADIEAGYAQWVEARQQAEALTAAIDRGLLEAATALKEEAAALRANNEALKAEMEDLRKSLDLIDRTGEPVCPLCGQALSSEHRAALAAQFEQAGRDKGDAWRDNKARIDAAGAQAQAYEAARAALKADDSFREQPGLADALSGLGFDPAQYRAALAQAADQAGYEKRRADLQAAEEKLPDLRRARSASRSASRSGRRSLPTTWPRWRPWTRSLPRCRRKSLRRWNCAGNTRSGSPRRTRRARRRCGRGSWSRCWTGSARRQELAAQQAGLREERAVYDELRAACGRNGVPAMIIEAVIPEIETSANDLLRKLTAGQINVRFETQREKKSSEGTIETLDIIVNDPLGDRAYEMYSGGEQFRVDFAVRIALSRLLARRAGAQLRTLVIDEGFGTQDATGRQRLVEAINAIQDDFAKIIVITHIDELKDAFPARIEIEKDRAGFAHQRGIAGPALCRAVRHPGKQRAATTVNRRGRSASDCGASRRRFPG